MDTKKLNDLTPDELVALSETNTSDFRWDRSEVYRTAFAKYESAGEKEKIEEMRKEILIQGFWVDSLINRATSKTAEQITTETKKQFTKETIEYYKKRAQITNNPILKARYCDMVWVFNREVLFARNAIKAYLNCVPILFKNEWDHELSDASTNALAIASSIKDNALIKECLDVHYDFIKQLAENKRYRYIIEIIESILNYSEENTINYDYLVLIIESAIKEYAENEVDSFHLQRSFIELLVKIWKIRKNNDEVLNANTRIAESYIAEAEWKKQNYPNGNSVASSFYEQAMKAYMDIGKNPEKVAELKVKIKDANETALKTEYKTIKTEVKIPKEIIDKHLDAYKGHNIIDIYKLLSVDPLLIPSYEKSIQQAMDQSQKFVMPQIVPIAVTRGNICVKHLFERNEKLEYFTIQNFQWHYSVIAQISLSEIFNLIVKEHEDYIESLIQYLAITGLINKERIEIIKPGLYAFKNKEYVSAIHVLLPQIEGILRDLLHALGLPTFIYKNNEMRQTLLSGILKTLSYVEGFDEDFLKFIEIFLCDIRGDNLRNDALHGLSHLAAFTKENSILLLLILIKLASLTVTEVKTVPE
jgi:hypothetical protein